MLDLFAMDGTSSFTGTPGTADHEFLQPLHLAAVVDVGSSLSTLISDRYDYWGGQNVPAIDGGVINVPPAFVFSYPRVENQPVYIHGEAVGDPSKHLIGDGWKDNGYPGISVRLARTDFGKPVTYANVEAGVSTISGG